MENDAFNSSSVVPCVFLAAGTCLPSHCQLMMQGDRHTKKQIARWLHKPFFFFFQNR
jgi:hypothetical protein